MNRLIKAALVAGGATALVAGIAFAEEDPFAAGADALAVQASDGSSSLRAKLKVSKSAPDVIQVSVKSVDDSAFPKCIVTARVLKAARSKKKHFRLIGRGKTYRFEPSLKLRRGKLVLKDEQTRQNLGACYYPPKTRLLVKVGGVDLKRKVFEAAAIQPK
jgi:hypothetical protein